jgi:DNA-directed RNA polymerase subunit RPC12/RpoP
MKDMTMPRGKPTPAEITWAKMWAMSSVSLKQLAISSAMRRATALAQEITTRCMDCSKPTVWKAQSINDEKKYRCFDCCMERRDHDGR